MDMLPYFLGRIAEGGTGGGGGVTYTSIVYNTDNTVTLTDKDGAIHTMSCTYADGKLIGVTYDGKAVDLTYNGDVLVKVGNTAVDIGNAPVNIAALDHTVTFTVDGEPYEIVSVKSGNSVNAPSTKPSKEDYRFSGWELNSEKVTFPYVPTENTDLIASFSQGIPSDYVLYVPLRQESATAETGQELSVVGSGLTYGVVDGVECAMFNSTSEIGVSVNSDLFVKGKPFTISMWAKADSVASYTDGPKFFGFNYNFCYYQCQNVSNLHNTPAFHIGDVWGEAVNTYRMTSWVHICLVYDGSQISMYNNGVSGEKYAISSNFSTTNTLYLGGNGSGDRFANGKMSAFRVYDRALTESEILILSQEFTPTDR